MKGSILAVACLSLVFGAAVGFLSTRPSRSDGMPRIRIGVPDDSGGLVLQVMGRGEGDGGSVQVVPFEPHRFKDCCSSSSEWALSSDELDGAVLCPDAAQRLVQRDGRFQVAGPCVMNSDAYVTRGDTAPGKVGVAHKREYQGTLVRGRFGPGCDTLSLLPSSLPFALARGLVDGIVVDGLKAIAIPSPRRVTPLSGERNVTYVLVTRRSLHENPAAGGFIGAYSCGARALNDPDSLAWWIGRLKGVTWSEREIQEWKSLNVQFVSPWMDKS